MDRYREYFKKYRADFIYGGVLLEGEITTFANTLEILKGKNTEDGEFVTNIVVNIASAWNFLFKLDGSYNPLGSTYLLRSFHSLLSSGVEESPTESAYRGKFRDLEVYIQGSSYVPKTYTISQTEEIIMGWFSVVLATPTLKNLLVLYVRLMRLQPFMNTNKRTAYLFVNALLRISNSGYLLCLPKTLSSSREFKKRLVRYYEDDSYEDELVGYLKRYYLRRV